MKKILVMLTLVIMMTVAGAVSAQSGYTHPSGAFSLIEYGELAEEVDDGALFASEDALVMVLFGEVPVEFTEEALPGVVMPLLDGLQDLDSYQLYSDETLALDNGYLIPFEYVTVAEDAGVGDVFVTQAEDILYVMILLAADYDAVADDWLTTVASFTPGDELAVAVDDGSAKPAPTKAKPTPTPSPTPRPTPTAPSKSSGPMSNGFSPTVDGFGFYNYGNDIPATNLTAEEVRRMFGDQVCASLAGDACTLSPPAQQWMQQINSYMGGGHCEGMAVLSALMYYDQIEPDTFGDDTPFDLTIDGNEPLQREIAYWWTTQATYPAANVRISESPSAVVNALIENFAQGKKADEWWAMGFYQPDGSEGHAVTPIGVEDKGAGLYNILIYDNNFPGETRIIEVDTNTETWQYEGSPNPEIESFLYTGDADAQNLELVAISPRLETQSCDFCSGGPVEVFGDGANSLNSMRGQTSSPPEDEPEFPIWADAQTRWGVLVYGEADDFYQIWLVGKADLLMIDDWGRRIGYDAGEFVNEIPGASTVNMRIFQQANAGLDKDKSPVYRVPVGLSFDIVVDGTLLAEPDSSDVTMLGPGYYLEVSGVYLEPGEMDTITVFVNKSRHQLTYYTDYSESPDIEIGLETDEAGYAMLIRATELVGAGDSFDIGIDFDTSEFIINTSYNTDPSTYEILVLRIDEAGEYVFGASDVVMDPDNTAYIPFTEWDGPGSSLRVDFDYENDGEIDDAFELPDISDEIDFYAEE